MTKVTVSSYEHGFNVRLGWGTGKNGQEQYNFYAASDGSEKKYVVTRQTEGRIIQEPVMIEPNKDRALGRARFEAFKCAEKMLGSLGDKGTLVDKTNEYGRLSENQLKLDLGMVVVRGKGIIET